MPQTEKRITFGDREIILIGTAHVSQESIDQVIKAIDSEHPDCVAIELDNERLASMKNPDSWKNLDIVKVLKEKKGFILMANLVLSSFQKRMGSDVGVKPGEEMKAAVKAAEDKGIPSVMVDRPIQTTLRRAWAMNSLWGKCKLLAVLLSSAFETESILNIHTSGDLPLTELADCYDSLLAHAREQEPWETMKIDYYEEQADAYRIQAKEWKMPEV